MSPLSNRISHAWCLCLLGTANAVHHSLSINAYTNGTRHDTGDLNIQWDICVCVCMCVEVNTRVSYTFAHIWRCTRTSTVRLEPWKTIITVKIFVESKEI